jgi:hypothetical protein
LQEARAAALQAQAAEVAQGQSALQAARAHLNTEMQVGAEEWASEGTCYCGK